MTWAVTAAWRDRVENYELITDYRLSPTISGEMWMMDTNQTVIYLRNWESIMIAKEADHETNSVLGLQDHAR